MKEKRVGFGEVSNIATFGTGAKLFGLNKNGKLGNKLLILWKEDGDGYYKQSGVLKNTFTIISGDFIIHISPDGEFKF